MDEEELFKAQKATSDVQGEIKKIEEKKATEGKGVSGMCANTELQQLLWSDNTEVNRGVVMIKAVVQKGPEMMNDIWAKNPDKKHCLRTPTAVSRSSHVLRRSFNPGDTSHPCMISFVGIEWFCESSSF